MKRLDVVVGIKRLHFTLQRVDPRVLEAEPAVHAELIALRHPDPHHSLCLYYLAHVRQLPCFRTLQETLQGLRAKPPSLEARVAMIHRWGQRQIIEQNH